MRNKRGEKDSSSVFEAGRSRRERSQLSATVRAKSEQRGSAPLTADEICEFVEDQTRQITAAVRLAASNMGRTHDAPTDAGGQSDDAPAPPAKTERCWKCDTNAEPHLHGAVMYEGGKVIF